MGFRQWVVHGGSMQPMAYDLKAMELTRERVYELMRLLD
ncbi:MAG: lysozyme inhibitor LprI family protein [Clostridium sp.]